jgi:cell division protease FtsH
MISEFAMGTGLTAVAPEPGSLSEATRRLRDQEMRELADEASRAARAIIETHRAQLDDLASTLLSKEVIERTDIDRIMRGVPSVAPERRGSGQLGIAAATALDPARADEPRRPER